MGDAHVGEGAEQSMHFAFGREDFWIERSWALASSTGMSAAILPLTVHSGEINEYRLVE